ncbi:tRNA pseudouridine(38-40) synthase TruA [Corynebacterium choanae]|uniref:tRNA pseudouridine synthase A n=1 Tax=Corynebacterium choanae TaxID=1862358 RepID=A0A3G6J914_9CORY|nr:tRNA pseudouridine(38-40) synthase TruA [Corynebacterium choanae]AZA14282.1 tRNA pseudouridine synthase A [Corynebacterium choanae]
MTDASADSLIRLRLDIAYDGTDFHGWAKQADPAIRTVQHTIEQAFGLIFQTPCPLTVAGRTDAGVHATGQVAHVDVPAKGLETRSIDGDPTRLVRRLTRLLPDDIRIHAVTVAPDGFDARFSALRRHYNYRITTAACGPLPQTRLFTAAWPRRVDITLMQQATHALLGLHDFAAYSKYRPGATTVRDLQAFSWREVSTAQEPDTYEATVIADAFTWSMVRSLVGATLAVGEGKQPISFTEAMLNERSRSSKIPVAPACGLTLTQVDYPAAAALAARAEQTRGVRVLPGEETRAVGKGCPETNPYFHGVQE